MSSNAESGRWLPLRPEAIDLEQTFWLMIFPDRPDLRARHAATHRTLDLKRKGQLPIPATWAEIDEIQKLEAEFSDRGAYDREMRRAERCGLIAGMILHRAIAFSKTEKDRASLSKIKRSIAEYFANKAPDEIKEQRLSEKTIDNYVWPTYKCVSHLWASYFFVVQLPEFAEGAIPCTRELFFLAHADKFRREGESIRLRKSDEILKAGECFRVPEEIPLPSVIMEWAPRGI